MIVKLLTEHHLEFLSIKGGCTGSPESLHVKMPHFWKSHAVAHLLLKKLNTLFIPFLLRSLKRVRVSCLIRESSNLGLKSWQEMAVFFHKSYFHTMI